MPGVVDAGGTKGSVALPRVRLRLLGGLVRLPSQVGAGDDPGQDAQPFLHPIPLRVGVLRWC